MKTYNYDTTLEWDEEDKTWVARVPALPGCIAFGDTQVDALEELQTAIPEWIAAAQESGFPYRAPVPDIDALKKASKLLNMTEVARVLGIAPRTLHSRLKNGTPFRAGEAEKLRDELAKHSVVLV